MDVHDVTSGHFQQLANQKELLQQATKRRGQRPRDRKSREETYLRFMMARRQVLAKKESRHMLHTSFIPPAYLPSSTSLAELRAIFIRDLQLEIHHRGTYLILRAITPPYRLTSIVAIGEDEMGDAIMLQLYQQEQENVREATEVVDAGMILLIKEPYFKVTASGDYSVRVDHLSDIVHIESDDLMVPAGWRQRIIEIDRTAESLKLDGNAFVKQGKYWKAIKEYSAALLQPATPEEVEIIKRNRSLALLKTKQFDAALSDTGYPHFGSSPSEKALFRAAEALYFLGRFSESCTVLEDLGTNFQGNKQALALLARARNRVSEQETGQYNFNLLQAEAKGLCPPHIDHATYIGPVDIRKTVKKGRGMFVTKAVKAGDLILCEKAFAHAHVAENNKSNSRITVLMAIDTMKSYLGGQADLIRVIAQKLYRNPSLAPAFKKLHHREYETVSTSSVDSVPIVDTFLVERIMEINIFGCPLSSLDIHKDVMYNQAKESKKWDAHHSCGVWTFASYINHSCTSNARRSFIGDMMIVRATQDLQPDTEVTFWYHSPEGTSAKALQEKFKNWDFVCECDMCKVAGTTPATVVAQREEILKAMKCILDAEAGFQPAKLQHLINALDNTYTRAAHDVPRLLVWDPQLLIARCYITQLNPGKAIEAVGKVLVALGFVVVGADASSTGFTITKWGFAMDHLVEALLHARTAFNGLGKTAKAGQAEEYAKTMYRIVVGEDTSFAATHSAYL
ncbi:hypothetical protein BDV95DRAFT_482850 [Massariosphaeria phaeospora]|uniref:SET domain-containing protein n=1 Tax=Massariosphaeria phaeospora TaxID=100035 RepID=A0A7C8IMA6_9PLEO|nr:hypothetical protein BDV95DRAFT_482850 [Massariosphaeria phaeospora]